VGTRYNRCSSILNSYSIPGLKPTRSFFLKPSSAYLTIPIPTRSCSNENLSLLATREALTDCHDNSLWELACINERLPEIYLNLSEKYIPQDLNLEINNIGVSFSKGCYPGQEVVARMYYLGKPKRRLFRFTSNFDVSIGDILNVLKSKSLKPSGQVIRVTKEGNKFHFLGVFEVSLINEQIFLNNDQNKLVSLIYE